MDFSNFNGQIPYLLFQRFYHFIGHLSILFNIVLTDLFDFFDFHIFQYHLLFQNLNFLVLHHYVVKFVPALYQGLHFPSKGSEFRILFLLYHFILIDEIALSLFRISWMLLICPSLWYSSVSLLKYQNLFARSSLYFPFTMTVLIFNQCRKLLVLDLVQIRSLALKGIQAHLNPFLIILMNYFDFLLSRWNQLD